jgi:hypothetical protein
MEKILEIKNFEGSRRSEVWQDSVNYRLMFYEHEKLVHSVNITDGLWKAELLAEDFAYGKDNPQLLTEGA